MLRFFNKQEVVICIMAYGINDVVANNLFANDSIPSNNLACLGFSSQRMGAVRICLVYIVDEADMHVVLGNWDFPEQ